MTVSLLNRFIITIT